MTTILLTGASGAVTGATIRALQGKGHRLIGLVRDPAKAKDLEKLGVELKTGDLEKPRSVEKAFEGIDVAWILTPAGHPVPGARRREAAGDRPARHRGHRGADSH